ncbi:MAG: hypothetical protein HY231_22920 [Acidobacteria bacterium]|nr:hypothetical protein [Acidobacteriota bacterium]
MGEAIGWVIVLAVVALMIWAFARASTRQRHRTAAEYERDIVGARESMLRAGMLELDKFVGEAKGKRAAVEYLKDEQQGQTKSGGKGDEAERTHSEDKP